MIIIGCVSAAGVLTVSVMADDDVVCMHCHRVRGSQNLKLCPG